MDNLLFYALLAAIAYYFLVYLPSQKSHSTSPDPLPTTHSKSTQTDFPRTTHAEPGPILNCPGPTLTSEDQTALEQTLDQLIKGMQNLSKELDE